jgi:hypothetical protein
MAENLIARYRAALSAGIANLEDNRDRRARELWRAALQMEHLLLADLLMSAEEDEVLAGIDAARAQACRDIFCRLETTIERSFASLTLGGGEALVLEPDTISENYLVRYEELARREIKLAGITARDRVLFIGSGPFPITAIEYCRQTGCTADCVDYVPEAVETSREAIHRLSLGARIRCHECRGEDFPAAEFSVVLVGVLAAPKQAIFDNLQTTCADGCRIIARTTFGLRQLIYGAASFAEDRVPRLRRSGLSEARGDQVISSWLYVKAA